MTDSERACTCPGGPNDRYEGGSNACIAGSEYGLCESEFCGGVCELLGDCPCPLHLSSKTHDSGFGGTYHD